MIRPACLLAALFAAFPVVASLNEDDLLPIDEAFALTAQADATDLRLHWRIADGYYLYRHRIAVKAVTADVVLDEPVLPEGARHNDEFFGEVETYRGELSATARIASWPASARDARFEVRYQGCADVGICYPPHRATVTVARPSTLAAASPAGDGKVADNPLARALTAPSLPTSGASDRAPLIGPGGSQPPLQDPLPADREPPLPEEQAFVFEAIAWSPTEVLARFTMPKNYYLYRNGTNFSVEGDGGHWQLAAPGWPTPRQHTDDHFGTVPVYFDLVEVPITVAPPQAGTPAPLRLTASFQGCQLDGICYPPMTRQVTIDMPAADAGQIAAAQAAIARDPYVTSVLQEREETGPVAGTGATVAATGEEPASSLGFIGALLLALTGGVLLNLMPCVLPILSLKVLGLARSGESVAKARSHALWYTAGVMTTFAAVGLAVVALRAVGLALGWGFQLQQPVVVALLAYVMFALGLSMSGVYNIGVGLTGAGQSLASRGGPAGDFFTGVLAVVVASPCTIPFMGSALAYAFASSSLLALLIFLALGLGLALPFLLVGMVPALASRLPRPGAWMETLKQFLAFPMYLTAIWLLWILGKQRGIDAVAAVLAGATVLALALWWWERGRYREGVLRRLLPVLVALLALAPLLLVHRAPPPAQVAGTQTGWVPYSAERLASLRAEGRTVFVDMTADWCVTCKANEKLVLHTDRFNELLERSGAVAMVGDWTNVDPEISAFLRDYGSVGVPLYVVFGGGSQGPGRKLPTVLTFGIVEAALAGTR
ncbi:protein-disulfide reductase DsbD family protein [Pseudofulvimonas gallinarii]|uniref:Thiol:disulfide interchange protein DsbD n=1 Tax=Pseudofulvimonas gallinarii TaxID=634155 RepID=A0A4R3LE38_9GAMM|nr:protein-disulfide reductase DsbD [Pseudofulvimonas gallinarii]TCS98152.1 thiol:disulfide interchange protein DsbD [Pseudofulvimonas gallinarii]THD13865.1 hypothetical protein B1808_06405 [Pseudofulvimonas gallinarii]